MMREGNIDGGEREFYARLSEIHPNLALAFDTFSAQKQAEVRKILERISPEDIERFREKFKSEAEKNGTIDLNETSTLETFLRLSGVK